VILRRNQPSGTRWADKRLVTGTRQGTGLCLAPDTPLVPIRHKKYNIADSCHCEGVCPKQSLTAEIASGRRPRNDSLCLVYYKKKNEMVFDRFRR
jgi:hypothetical protein